MNVSGRGLKVYYDYYHLALRRRPVVGERVREEGKVGGYGQVEKR